MKLIIYLASKDKDAQANYSRLVSAMQDKIGIQESHTVLEFNEKNGKLVDQTKQLLNKILLAERDNIEIDFVAHGNPNSKNEILVLPQSRIVTSGSTTFVALKPENIAEFFKTNGSQDNEFKFKNLTLFCCSSYEFGKELSKLMPGVNITCFNEDIRIDDNGIAYNGHNQSVIATPHTFSLGVLLTPAANQNLDEKKSEANEGMRPTANETLSAPKQPIIRGDPFARFRSQSFDSYLQTERKSNAPEQIPSTPEISHSSTLRKIPTPSEPVKESEQPPSSARPKR
jgi:hypothetical protein